MDRRPAGAVRVAAAALFGAELIHTAVIPAHLREWAAAGWFFLVVSMLEGLLAAMLLFAPSATTRRAAAWLSALTIGVWLVSRSVGVPFGPEAWVREPLASIDIASTTLELVTLVAVTVGRQWRGWADPRIARAGLVGVAAVTALGLIGAPSTNAQHGGARAAGIHALGAPAGR